MCDELISLIRDAVKIPQKNARKTNGKAKSSGRRHISLLRAIDFAQWRGRGRGNGSVKRFYWPDFVQILLLMLRSSLILIIACQPASWTQTNSGEFHGTTTAK